VSRFQGREIDDIGLWSRYIEIPPGAEKEESYWDKTQCPNPKHDTNKHHFQVNVRDGLVHCFAHCGISGSYVHALCVIHGYYDEIEDTDDHREKRRRLDRAKRPARKEILEFAGRGPRKGKTVRGAARPVADAISAESLLYDSFIPQAGLEYLENRGISASSVSRFGIGWDSKDLRLVIPGRDINGQVRVLIKRAVKESQHPKYLYTEGFPKTSLLFGACDIDLQLIKSQGLVLVEGSLDAVRLHQHGHRNAVAILGTGISPRQVEIVSRLRPRRVLLFFDRDSAGVANVEIAERRFRGKYPMFVVRYPKGRCDPAECSRREVEKAIDRAIPLRDFKRRVRQLGKVAVI